MSPAKDAISAADQRGVGTIEEVGTFVRVVRQASLAGAARELGVPKSTVSRRVARLEERLGIDLLHRDGRRTVLTKEGCRFYDRIAASVDAIELAVRSSAEGVGTPRGHVRLTAPHDFGRMVLVPELVSFGEICPEITFHLELTDRYVDLVQEGFDLAVRAGPGPKTAAAEQMITRKLTSSVFQIAAGPALAARVGAFSDLSSLPFILFRSTSGTQTLRLKNAAGRVYETTVRGRFSVDDYASMAAFVERGAGLGLLPRMHIEPGVERAALQVVLPELSLTPSDIAVVYPSKRLPRRVSLLIEHLTRRLRP